MSRTFKMQSDPYDTGEKLFTKKEFTFEPGVTVLVGCNGTGKTTLLQHLEEQLKKDGVPVKSYDNLRDGGSRSISSAAFFQDFEFVATAATSSEGENIVMNIGKMASSLRPFIQTGETRGQSNKLAMAFARAVWGDENKDGEKEVPKERWLLLDAVDSGLSVDNIVDVKEHLFKTILEDAGDCDVYILVSANEYEIARGENCFDVRNGKYITFKDYEAYREFILKSREKKDARIASAQKRRGNKGD